MNCYKRQAKKPPLPYLVRLRLYRFPDKKSICHFQSKNPNCRRYCRCFLSLPLQTQRKRMPACALLRFLLKSKPAHRYLTGFRKFSHTRPLSPHSGRHPDKHNNASPLPPCCFYKIQAKAYRIKLIKQQFLRFFGFSDLYSF